MGCVGPLKYGSLVRGVRCGVNFTANRLKVADKLIVGMDIFNIKESEATFFNRPRIGRLLQEVDGSGDALTWLVKGRRDSGRAASGGCEGHVQGNGSVRRDVAADGLPGRTQSRLGRDVP